MKNRMMKSALTLCLFATMGFGSSAFAELINVVITFDGEAGGGTQETTIGDYRFADINVTNGTCGDADPCINLSASDSFTLSRVDGLAFDLVSFWLYFSSNVAELTVSGEVFCTQDCTGLGLNSGWTDGEDAINGTHFDLTAATSFVFSSSGGNANIRLDDFSLNYDDGGNGELCPDGSTPPCEDPPQPVPEPGTLGLLGLGLLGLSLRRRRQI